MGVEPDFSGVISAVVTPLSDNGHPNLENLQLLICTLVTEGVDGILLLGTTGEGPSLSMLERQDVITAGLEAADGVIVMAGTGFTSLGDTIYATCKAFELGVDAVVVVPPYYYKNVPQIGLDFYFKNLIDEAIPENKHIFLYDIPQVTNVPISIELIASLLDYAPRKFRGVKDSTGDINHGKQLIREFPSLNVFVGTDKLLLDGLCAGAAGCITAGTNVLAPLAVDVYAAYTRSAEAGELQETLTAARVVLESYPPFPPALKSLLALRFGSPGWEVRYPLIPLHEEQRDDLLTKLKSLNIEAKLKWLNLNSVN